MDKPLLEPAKYPETLRAAFDAYVKEREALARLAKSPIASPEQREAGTRLAVMDIAVRFTEDIVKAAHDLLLQSQEATRQAEIRNAAGERREEESKRRSEESLRLQASTDAATRRYVNFTIGLFVTSVLLILVTMAGLVVQWHAPPPQCESHVTVVPAPVTVPPANITIQPAPVTVQLVPAARTK
jgi:hypothetical protein